MKVDCESQLKSCADSRTCSTLYIYVFWRPNAGRLLVRAMHSPATRRSLLHDLSILHKSDRR
jgi:hypothetical protein